MRRAFPVAFLGALLAFAPVAIAQHGGIGHAGGFGGGHSFGGHGFGGGFAAHSFGNGFAGHSFGSPGRIATFGSHSFGTAAPHFFGTAPRNAIPTFSYHAPYFGRPAYGSQGRGDHRGWNHDRDHYRNPYGGYGYGYGYGPWLNSWELLPWDLGYPDFTGYDNDYGEFENGDNDDATQQAQQPYQDQQEPQQDQDNYGYGPAYSAYPYPPQGYSGYPGTAWQPQPVSQPAPPELKLTLVFKDGQRQQIQNYVLTPSSIIVMDQAASGRQQEIPLAELNLPATELAAQQQGLQFAPPS